MIENSTGCIQQVDNGFLILHHGKDKKDASYRFIFKPLGYNFFLDTSQEILNKTIQILN